MSRNSPLPLDLPDARTAGETPIDRSVVSMFTRLNTSSAERTRFFTPDC